MANGGDSAYDRVQYSYDRLGRKTQSTDQIGNVHDYVFDSAGRLQQDKAATLGDANVDGYVRRIQRGYDDISRVQTVTSYGDVTGDSNPRNEVKFVYNKWHTVSKSYQAHDGLTDANSPVVQYTWEDGTSGGTIKYVRLDYITYPGAARHSYYNYPTTGVGEKLSRLGSIANSGSADPNGSSTYVTYTYLGAGTVVKAAHPAVSGGLNLTYGTGGTYGGFDAFGRVIDQKWENDSATAKDRFRYGYDRNSNRIWKKVTETTALDEFYNYDGLDRLASSERGTLTGTDPNFTGVTAGVRKEAWNLEALGNWRNYQFDVNDNGDPNDPNDLNQARAHNAVNEVGAVTETSGQSVWVDPVYDKGGNMTSGPKAGAVADGATRLHYKYDAWNRLVGAYNDSSGQPGTAIAEYRYDGLNRRIQKLVGQDTFDYYYSENWQVLEERKNGSANPYAQYVWDARYIDAPVVRWRDTNTDGTVDETLYYTNDGNFNVTALIDPASGNPVERYLYDSYGQPTFLDGSWGSRSSSSYLNEILYCGYRYDGESGLFHVRNRMYHPTLGRWLQRDPIGYVDGMNLCQYVYSRPIAYLDALGLELHVVYIHSEGTYPNPNSFTSKFVPTAGHSGMHIYGTTQSGQSVNTTVDYDGTGNTGTTTFNAQSYDEFKQQQAAASPNGSGGLRNMELNVSQAAAAAILAKAQSNPTFNPFNSNWTADENSDNCQSALSSVLNVGLNMDGLPIPNQQMYGPLGPLGMFTDMDNPYKWGEYTVPWLRNNSN